MIDRGRLIPAAALLLAAASVTACAGGSPDAQSAVPLATATPDDAPDEPATLDILAMPSTEVKLDGKPIGKTPIKGYKVPPGTHDVTFIDETGNRTMTVNVAAGDGKTLNGSRPPSPSERKH